MRSDREADEVVAILEREARLAGIVVSGPVTPPLS
jgi:hypothetical protein